MTTSKSTPNLTETLDKTPPHGMKGAMASEASLSPAPLLVAAMLILIVSVVVSLVLYILVWKKRRKSLAKTTDGKSRELSSWEQLRKSIDLITVPEDGLRDESNDIRDHEFAWNEFSSGVSLCLRRALELKTGFPLAECTTEEIYKILAKRQIQLVIVSDDELRRVLELMDQIRFGGFRVSRNKAEDVLRSLKNWCADLEKGEEKKTSFSTIEIPSKTQSVSDQRGGNVFLG